MVTALTHHDLLPAGSLRCVWMDAGLVSWHLCDRALDCEGCPFDEALRGQMKRDADADDGSPFPEHLRYDRSHLWVLSVGRGLLRLGLDGFASEILASPAEVELARRGTRLPRSAPLAVLHLPQGDVTLPAPFDLQVATSNDVLDTRPALAVRAPYDAGWLVEVLPRDDVLRADGEAFLTAPEMRRQSRLDRERFRRRMARTLLRHDGSEPLPEGPRAGRAAWLSVVRDLLR